MPVEWMRDKLSDGWIMKDVDGLTYRVGAVLDDRGNKFWVAGWQEEYHSPFRLGTQLHKSAEDAQRHMESIAHLPASELQIGAA